MKRVAWIDISKGICIILMIVGHMCEYGSTVRNVIYSFHMPLFFILAGYTFHFEKLNWQEFIYGLIKDFKRLYIPVLVVQSLIVIVNTLIYHDGHALYNSLVALYWASGYEETGPYLGACWFLVCMFWARVFIRLMLLFIDPEKIVFISIAIGSLEMIHLSYRPIPQNFYGTLAAIMFITIGHLYRKHERYIYEHQDGLIIISAVIWTYCLSMGWYQEIVGRNYPFGMVSALEALCGTFICFSFADAIDSGKYVKTPLQYLGKHTLLLLCIHCVDVYWANVWNFSNNLIISIIARIMCDLLVLEAIIAAFTIYKKIISQFIKNSE